MSSTQGAKTSGANVKTSGRPPAWLRLAVDHVWLLWFPLLVGLFLLAVDLTNSIDLTDVPPHPRVVQLAMALAGMAVILGIPYLVFRHPIDWARDDLALHREAKITLRSAQRLLARHKAKLSSEASAAVSDSIADLEKSLADDDNERLVAALSELDKALAKYLAFSRTSATKDAVGSLSGALLVALLVRAFALEAFKIPSGSMIPTLQVGDHIFVNKILFGLRIPYTNIKFAHHLRPPQRGEVIVFVYPHNQEKDYIKRVVGIPGDKIEICDEVITVNGARLPRKTVSGPCGYDDSDEEHPESGWQRRSCRDFLETNGGNEYHIFQEPVGQMFPCKSWVVAKDHVFVMGDNRDHSADSRFWCESEKSRGLSCESNPNGSFVPYEMIKGKAWFVWWSAGKGSSVRLPRLFSSVH